MADTYGVTPDDVADELRNLFPNGFAATTVPSLAQVVGFITIADLEVAIAVQNAAGEAPSASDKLSPLAEQVILNRVIARVLRVVYAGNKPEAVAALVSGYTNAEGAAEAAILALGAQLVGATGDPVSRVITSSTVPERDLLVCDADLGPAPHGRSSAYGSGIDRGRF